MALINERHIDTDRAGDNKGGGNYGSLTDYLNQKKVLLTPFRENDISVAGAQFALLDNTIISGNLAIDITSEETNGGIVVAPLAGAIGAASLNAIVDAFTNITNLAEVRDSDTHDPLMSGDGRKVYGLLQTAGTAVDGDAIAASGSENLQISFVVFDAPGNVAATVVTGSVEIAVPQLYSLRHFPDYEKRRDPLDDVVAAPTPTASAGIFATDVTNDGTGIVGDKVYIPNTVPANTVISQAGTDDDTVEIHFMVEGGVAYSPSVTVDGITCTNLQQHANDRRLFYGSVSVVCPTTRSVPIVSSTGSSTSVTINRAPAGPTIDAVVFTGGYPVGQTEVKENDTFDISIDFDPAGTEPTNVFIQNSGALKAQTISLAGSGLNWGTTHTAVITVTIDATGNTVQALAGSLNAENSFGTIGNTLSTDDGGSTVDGTNLVNCNDVIPTFVDNGTSFPASQSAFKLNEVGTQDTTVNNYSSAIYSSPHGDFTITDPTVVANSKTITCTNPGDYNDSSTNFRIVAVRAANGTAATFNKTIEVADVAPVVTVTQPQARLQTSEAGANYTITASSNQNLASAPDLDVPVSGTWQGGAFVGGAKVWTRAIRLVETDAAGTAAWGWASTAPTNNAGLSATITGDETVGGFISRTVTLPAFATVVNMTAEVSDPSKLTFTWSFKPGMVYQPIGTAPPVVLGWTIDGVGLNPTQIQILDVSAAAASSQASTITIEEAV